MKLTKLFSILCFMLLIVIIPTHSQNYRDIRQKWGSEFIAGINTSSLDFVGNNTYNKLKIGFQLGFLADYSVTPIFFIQSGYVLKRKGGERHFKFNKNEGGVISKRDTKFEIDASYMYIPLSIGARVPLSKSTAFSVTGGAYLGYGFKGKVKQEGTVIFDNTPTNDNKNQIDVFGNCFKRFDYGLIASASLYFGGFYFFRVEVEQGIPNVAKSDFIGEDSNYQDLRNVTKIRTISTSFSLGFRF